MSRSVNQSIAWLSAVLISLLVFSAGYGLFSMMAHGDGNADVASSDHDSHGNGSSHGEGAKAAAEGHDGQGEVKQDKHGEEKHEAAVSGEHEAPKHASVEDDSHEDKNKEKENENEKPKGNAKEEEISSEHFKKKEADHH